MTQFTAVVMAAGHGTRMKSSTPKVLHLVGGRPIIYYPVRAALSAGADRVIIVVNPDTREAIGHALGWHFPDVDLMFATQEIPRGTGDAVRVALTSTAWTEPSWTENDRVVVLSGDTPLLEATDLAPILDALERGEVLSFLSFSPPDPTGYGRVLRDASGQPRAIREQRDLVGAEEWAVGEVNAGMYGADARCLLEAVRGLSSDNAQGEYYLTDIVPILAARGAVSAHAISSDSALGVNHRGELHAAQEILFERIRARLGRDGVTIVGRPLIDDTVRIAPDAMIEDGVRLRGNTTIGARTRVDVGCVIENCALGEDVYVKPYSMLSASEVGDGAQIGPFAHLRPGSILEADVHVGNFVETKNTRMRRASKANHLSYLGDGDVGEKANIGAGTIFCNYDGFSKHKTIIGARAFVGSDSQLVAPVTIGDDAYVATGTTVTADVPPGALAMGRVRQENKLGYADQLRGRLRATAAASRRDK